MSQLFVLSLPYGIQHFFTRVTLSIAGELCVLGLRKTMVRAHRQAWCWQDEYYGLTIDDIRRLERETQLALQQKMTSAEMSSDQASAGGHLTASGCYFFC